MCYLILMVSKHYKWPGEYDPDIPFFFVSGAVSEEFAAETILTGGWGFVLKSKLLELPSIINNILLQVEQRKLDAEAESVDISTRIKRQIERNQKLLNKVQEFMAEESDEDDFYPQK